MKRFTHQIAFLLIDILTPWSEWRAELIECNPNRDTPSVIVLRAPTA